MNEIPEMKQGILKQDPQFPQPKSVITASALTE
jgi:hypothetical protein